MNNNASKIHFFKKILQKWKVLVIALLILFLWLRIPISVFLDNHNSFDNKCGKVFQLHTGFKNIPVSVDDLKINFDLPSDKIINQGIQLLGKIPEGFELDITIKKIGVTFFEFFQGGNRKSKNEPFCDLTDYFVKVQSGQFNSNQLYPIQIDSGTKQTEIIFKNNETKLDSTQILSTVKAQSSRNGELVNFEHSDSRHYIYPEDQLPEVFDSFKLGVPILNLKQLFLDQPIASYIYFELLGHKKNSDKVDMSDNLKVAAVYTLKGIKGDFAYIDVKLGPQTLEKSDELSNLYKIVINGQGHIIVDIKNAKKFNSKMLVTLKSNIEVAKENIEVTSYIFLESSTN